MSSCAATDEASPEPPIRVLLVEDEFLIRMTLVDWLGGQGFDVLEAEDAATALATLDTHPAIAVLLTDVQLPGGTDGRELVRRARLARPDLPVVFMTGRPDALPAPEAGAPELVLGKPYLPSDVSLAIRRLVTGRIPASGA